MTSATKIETEFYQRVKKNMVEDFPDINPDELVSLDFVNLLGSLLAHVSELSTPQQGAIANVINGVYGLREQDVLKLHEEAKVIEQSFVKTFYEYALGTVAREVLK
jgi:hypothetical protein